ncbi:GntR family transcriptional regulator [Mycolicibacterium smegmatis]|uniref:GntR-family transcriptional regulator n=2 Tax=Mycolicibacterium smegmatis (strain ATCC 700084 / mc(2)155) TaxID=246196 RepID=I7G1C0_MYCS2|nr:GntR family transcriptional regulator [Mycolicibacterium smegmatis]ABK75769.1 transcriptional regulator, GntR family protein [Mycolicibacterium smegmatis MC2 155]AFP36656.1 GntR-family transcriptional regulator [Mycolicibacterium smegmatis MC2 155]AIU05460.1 GntR family transcriptional regulator [Mycolicibacterium smegmatis MC2 155]AIU12085.1 GntR family transcriptional regulator [Mycolicibacterium smegmatis]AIU18709.1 GntR family transcriptional regulator [Mycolicibacterium smegmatis]
MLPDLSVNRSTTVERVSDALRAAVLSGELTPGTPLREVDLAERMKVSRGSVREALVRLSDEGLLRRTSFRGVEVKQLTADEIRDLFVVRKLIELTAVDAAGTAGAAALAELRRAVDEFGQAIRTGAAVDRNRADMFVHITLVGLLNSPRLSRIHGELMSELQLALVSQYRDSTILPGTELTNRHEEFLRMLLDGDTVGAREQLERRLDLAQRLLLGTADPGEN